MLLTKVSLLSNYQKLIEWDIYEDGVAMDLINHNKNCSKYGTNNN